MVEHTPESDAAQVAQVLETAADVLVVKGWTRGAFFRDGDDQAYCAIGAIRSARRQLGVHPMFTGEAIKAANIALGKPFNGYSPLMNFNDRASYGDNGGSAEAVVELFKLTAKDLRNGS